MPFTKEPVDVSIPESALVQLKTLLKAAPAIRDTYEGSNRFSSDSFTPGVTTDWINAAKARWEDGYSWRTHEREINQFNHFKSHVVKDDGLDLQVHYILEKSVKEGAIPLLLLHGWPGSFLEFLQVIKPLTEGTTPSFHVIVPSHIGYAFSSPPPLDRDFTKVDEAEVMHKLMCGLGFQGGYAVQAGDWGSMIARIMAVKYDSVKAINLNFIPVSTPDQSPTSPFSPEEQKAAERSAQFLEKGRAYSLEHANQPSTISIVLGSSPVGLLAWIGEKFLAWSDQDPPLDEILTSLTLWWCTQTFPTSIYPYRDRAITTDSPEYYIKTPTGYSSFPKELLISPRNWAEKSANIQWYRKHDKGGHFAAMEQPELFIQDMRDCFGEIYPKI